GFTDDLGHEKRQEKSRGKGFHRQLVVFPLLWPLSRLLHHDWQCRRSSPHHLPSDPKAQQSNLSGHWSLVYHDPEFFQNTPTAFCLEKPDLGRNHPKLPCHSFYPSRWLYRYQTCQNHSRKGI